MKKEISFKNTLNNNNNENSSESENSNKEDYKQIKNEIKNKKKKEKNIGKILKSIIHKSYKIKDNNVILSKAQEPFKKLEKEREEKKILKEKRELHRIQKMLGYSTYDKWDKLKEKKLLKITTRGVVKLFNSIFEFRKKEKEEKIEEEKKIEKKGNNFLMLHNLDPNFKSKFYEEDKNNNIDNNDNNNKNQKNKKIKKINYEEESNSKDE